MPTAQALLLLGQTMVVRRSFSIHCYLRWEILKVFWQERVVPAATISLVQGAT